MVQRRGAGRAGVGILVLMLMQPVVAQTGIAGEVHQFELRIAQRQVTVMRDLSHADSHATTTARGRHNVVVRQGESVRLTWHSDEAVQLHLHGYDIELNLQPGQPGVMDFTARATGRFPVTSHGFGASHGGGHHQGLLYFEVHPD